MDCSESGRAVTGPGGSARRAGLMTNEIAPAAEAPKVCTIKTNKGGQIVETPIACTN